jgi:hypothetical protein
MVGTEAVEVGRAGEEIARQIAILRRQKLLEGDAQLPIGPDDDRAQVPPKAGLTILAEKAAGATFGGRGVGCLIGAGLAEIRSAARKPNMRDKV